MVSIAIGSNRDFGDDEDDDALYKKWPVWYCEMWRKSPSQESS